MGLRLLIVDDNAIQIKSVLSYVDWEKYHVSEIRKAFDGEEGFAIAKEFEPQLIITDVDMPKLNGIELAKKLRAINSKAEFIFITCHESFQFAHEAISLRAKAYILKPIVRHEFAETVAKVILELEEQEQEQRQKVEFLAKQQQIERDFNIFSEDCEKLDVLTVYDEMIKLISEKKQDNFIHYFQDKYFKKYSNKSITITKYLCYTIINALHLFSKTKGIDLETLFGTRTIWDKMATFTNGGDLINWLTNIMRMLLLHVMDAESSAYEKIANDIKGLIDNSLYEIKSVEYIAQKLQISSSYAQKIFKKYTGMTIFDYLFEARMKEAERLLQDPYLRIYEIADKLGYKNKAYFSSAFQKFSGMTPNDYRKISKVSYE